MKKTILIIALAVCSLNLLAQGGGFQRQTPEERTEAVMTKIAELKLDESTTAKAKIIFNDFFTAQQKAMEEMRSSGSMDREGMMQKRQELVEARDKKLKEIFTKEQMKKWMDDIEPSLRPQRRGN